MRDILVVFGGKSCEHDVSVITGVLTLNSLDKTAFNGVPIYITETGEWLTGGELKNVSFYKQKNFSKLKRVTFVSGSDKLFEIKRGKLKPISSPYSVINCLHGLNGEDGTLAGYIKLVGLPLVSPGIFQSAFTIDKQFTKIVLSGLKIKTLNYLSITREEYYKNPKGVFEKVESQIGYPVIIKPANLGSSIGIGVASDNLEFEKALKTSFLYDEKTIVEPRLENPVELNCSAYKFFNETVVSQIEKPLKSSEILSFADKYYGFKGGENGREFPAEIDKKLAQKVQAITRKIYEELSFSGVIRIDFLFDGKNLFVNEINSVPGSLAYYLHGDLSNFTKNLSAMIAGSVKEFNEYKSRRFVFSSSVLQIEGPKGGKNFDKQKNK